jgi:hypothetical protein
MPLHQTDDAAARIQGLRQKNRQDRIEHASAAIAALGSQMIDVVSEKTRKGPRQLVDGRAAPRSISARPRDPNGG